MLIATLPQQVWTVLVLLVSGFALWRGGWPERVVAVANLAAWLLTPLFYSTNLLSPQWGVFLVDLLFLVILVALAIRSDRTWLLYASAFQFLGVVTHIAIAVDHGVRTLAYFRGLVIFSYLVLAALAAGAWTFRRPMAPATDNPTPS